MKKLLKSSFFLLGMFVVKWNKTKQKEDDQNVQKSTDNTDGPYDDSRIGRMREKTTG